MHFLVTLSIGDIIGFGSIILFLLVLLVIWGLDRLQRSWRWIKRKLGRKK
jgi:hypothetical protein